jgi:hypothetical protein
VIGPYLALLLGNTSIGGGVYIVVCEMMIESSVKAGEAAKAMNTLSNSPNQFLAAMR